MDELSFTDRDGVEVFYRRWSCASSKVTVVIAHGASEHSGRYERFARFLNSVGAHVYAIDHRGHGLTAASTGPGRLGPRGMEGVLDDLGEVLARARAETGLPVVLFGHSMGALLTQAFVERPDAAPDRSGLIGYALSGCPGPLDGIDEMVAGIEAAVAAGMGEEPVDMLGPFNEAFEPARTASDWLSRDPDEVDRYLADPMCGAGMPLTYAYVAGMLAIVRDAISDFGLAQTPDTLPVLLLTGMMDPTSGMAAQVRVLEQGLRATGLTVTAHYYPDARHEVLNEINRDEVYADVAQWLGELR